MKVLRPNRTLYVLFGLGAALVFLSGAALWHTLIDGNSLDCSYKGVVCLLIPDRSDWYIHFISYALMLPLMSALLVGFNAWRRQWVRLNALTRNLAVLSITDPKLESVATRLGLKEKVNLLDSADCLCFCASLKGPQIFISRGVVEKLTETELEALLLHEKYHLNNHDPLRIWLGRLTVSSLFFAPILKDLFKRYLIRKEIAADRFAMRFQGHRRGLAGALQKFLTMPSPEDNGALAISGTEALEYRINYLAGRPDLDNLPLHSLPLSLVLPLLLTVSIIASITILRASD